MNPGRLYKRKNNKRIGKINIVVSQKACLGILTKLLTTYAQHYCLTNNARR